jgi:hypothetical protein
MKFIWDDDYKKIEEGNREEKYWITSECKIVEVPRFKYHKDYVDDYDIAIKDGWIRVLVSGNKSIYCVCDKIDNASILKIHKFLKTSKNLETYPIFVNENRTNNLKAYKPMMKEEIVEYILYKKVFKTKLKESEDLVDKWEKDLIQNNSFVKEASRDRSKFEYDKIDGDKYKVYNISIPLPVDIIIDFMDDSVLPEDRLIKTFMSQINSEGKAKYFKTYISDIIHDDIFKLKRNESKISVDDSGNFSSYSKNILHLALKEELNSDEE